MQLLSESELFLCMCECCKIVTATTQAVRFHHQIPVKKRCTTILQIYYQYFLSKKIVLKIDYFSADTTSSHSHLTP